jgi:predicted dehydrogenase
MLNWSGNSGPEWFLFPHTMDVVRWLFGRNPVEVYAKGYRGVLESRGIECWDAIQTMIEFEGRAFCVRNLLDPSELLQQRRRQPAVDLR